MGNEKVATVKRRIVCRNCKGKAHLPRCSSCGSCPKEKKMVHRRAGPGMVVQQEVMVESKEKCKREEKSLRATIEKGMPDSEEITFKYATVQWAFFSASAHLYHTSAFFCLFLTRDGERLAPGTSRSRSRGRSLATSCSS